MLDRRQFLQAALVLGGLPLAPGLVRAVTTKPRLLAVVASQCADGRRFAASLVSKPITPAPHDPMELLSALAETLPAVGVCEVAGLGTEAHYFVLATEAPRLGLVPNYVGRHTYVGATVSHSLRGGRGIGLLAQALTSRGSAWAETLANEIRGLPRAGHEDGRGSARASRPADGGGHLVSWVFVHDADVL